MAQPLKPKRGGFLRPFRCGEFVRDFLKGEGPQDSSKIDPLIGSPQADIFREYKLALMRATALDRATKEEEERARRQKRYINPDNITELANEYLARMAYKSFGCRSHSFTTYFSMLQKLGWAEATGEEEPSSFQDHYPEAQPRKYFILTKAGKEASDVAWANPRLALYGQG